MTIARRPAAVVATLALTGGLLAATGTAAQAADPIDGAQTVGDSLYPQQGNGGYDALHYDLDLKVDVAISSTNNAAATTTFDRATATIDARTTGAPLRSYSFDFQGSTGNLEQSTLKLWSANTAVIVK